MQVKFFATYREITRDHSIDIAAPETVLALLHVLANTYGDTFRSKVLTPDGTNLGQDAIVMVNGRHIDHLDGVQTKLGESDIVAVFPLVAGG